MKGLIIALILLPAIVLANEGNRKGLPLQVAENSAKYLHVREKTNHNDALEIDKFLGYLGLPKGLSWCAAFVVYNYKEASESLNMKNPLPRYGRVSMLWEYARANELRYRVIGVEELAMRSAKLQVADIPVWAHGRIPESGNFDGHTGIVLKQTDDKTFLSREGNTMPSNSGNQREGGGVYDRKRGMGIGSGFRVLGFIRVRGI